MQADDDVEETLRRTGRRDDGTASGRFACQALPLPLNIGHETLDSAEAIMELSMRRILVTGGCGFIGANFIRLELEE